MRALFSKLYYFPKVKSQTYDRDLRPYNVIVPQISLTFLKGFSGRRTQVAHFSNFSWNEGTKINKIMIAKEWKKKEEKTFTSSLTDYYFRVGIKAIRVQSTNPKYRAEQNCLTEITSDTSKVSLKGCWITPSINMMKFPNFYQTRKVAAADVTILYFSHN